MVFTYDDIDDIGCCTRNVVPDHPFSPVPWRSEIFCVLRMGTCVAFPATSEESRFKMWSMLNKGFGNSWFVNFTQVSSSSVRADEAFLWKDFGIFWVCVQDVLLFF